MRTVDLIQKKRDGQALTAEEIRFLIDGYSQGKIPDYQMSAWAMAVFFQGMTAEETASLTMAMAVSGEQIDLGHIHGIKVDKHSTGGVGDTTTLVLASLVAAAGVPVAKMSGRGLGHTGGTIDKLESIPGFSVELTRAQFVEQVNQIGVAVMSQSGNITPADKQLYALRDVTATVDSIPLIASSIMSKKIASGADAIVLDVKTGKGAFMKTLEQSIALAETMVRIGEHVGLETVAVVTDMNQPLGFAVGNALEVKEAIETLRGQGPGDLRELCLELGAYMVLLGKRAKNVQMARQQLEQLMETGHALDKFKQLIAAQGGDPQVVDQPDLLPVADQTVQIQAPASGYIQEIEAETMGVAAMMLGAGRETKQSGIDPAVGIVLHHKVGDRVQKGDLLATLYVSSSKTDRLSIVQRHVLQAFHIDEQAPGPRKLIHAIITKDGVQMM